MNRQTLPSPRLLILAAILLITSCSWLLLPLPASPTVVAGLSGGSPVTGPPSAAAAAPSTVAPGAGTGERLVRLDPVDLLTGDPLRLERLELWSPTAAKQLPSEEAVAVPASLLEDPEAHWVYELPTLQGPRSMAVRASAAGLEGTRLPLPYRSGLRGAVRASYSGQPLSGVRVQAYLFETAKLDLLRREMGRPGKMPPEALDSFRFLKEHYQQRFGDLQIVEAVTDAEGRFEMVLPASGTVVVHAWHPDTTPATSRIEARAGAWTEWAPDLDQRPVVFGTVRDEEGRPAAGLEVRVGALVEHDSDALSPLDQDLGFASIQASESPGHLPVVVAWQKTRTDAGGRYRVAMPASRRYAVTGCGGAAYGFRETVNRADYQRETRLDLTLQARSALPPVEFRFQDGTPVAGARVDLCVVADFPWFRQFPAARTDNEGLLDLTWREAGQAYGLFLRHPRIRGAFPCKLAPGTTLVTVPSEHTIAPGR